MKTTHYIGYIQTFYLSNHLLRINTILQLHVRDCKPKHFGWNEEDAEVEMKKTEVVQNPAMTSESLGLWSKNMKKADVHCPPIFFAKFTLHFSFQLCSLILC
jgi:hypothetical protein